MDEVKQSTTNVDRFAEARKDVINLPTTNYQLLTTKYKSVYDIISL